MAAAVALIAVVVDAEHLIVVVDTSLYNHATFSPASNHSMN
jgi:hypothetical protein